MFQKTVLSTDRLVALPGRSNFTPRLRGQVNLRGAGGGSKSATVPYGIVVFLKLRIRGQTARSTDPFVKMSVSPRRNGQFAAESDPPGRFLDDPNEEIGRLRLNGIQGLRSGQVDQLSTSEIME